MNFTSAPAIFRCFATMPAPPTKSTWRSYLRLRVGVFVLPPISEQYVYESTIVSPTTWTLTPLNLRSVSLSPSNDRPSASMRAFSLSIARFGGSLSMIREEE